MKFPSKKKKGGPVDTDAARKTLASATAFERSNADAIWAALLSLEDAAEFCKEAQRLAWKHHPRGKDNIELFDRYGAGILPWIAGRVSNGVLENFPWCIGPCLLAIGTPEAFDLVWSLRGFDDTSEMVAWEVQPKRTPDAAELEAAAKKLRDAWIRTHEDVANERIEALAEKGDARAKEILEKRARGSSEERILETLDEHAEQGWPGFHYPKADGRVEYFAMRLIAARGKGDEWGVLFQRLGGSYPDALSVQQFAYGTKIDDPFVDAAECTQIEWEGDGFHGATVTGPAADVVLDEGMIDELDLRFGRCVQVGYHPYRVAVIRAYLAKHPDAFWPDPKDALEVLRLGKGATVIVVSDAFHHVDRPSESPVFRSLAKAIATRDPNAFEPGESNLDWRLHAETDEPVPPPWTVSRFEPPFLKAAMKEAAVKTDGRGLMPVEEARAHLQSVTRFERGKGERVEKHWVQGSDRTWAALLSLGDASELKPLEFAMPIRSAAENTALAERYGSSAVSWIRTFVKDGVLVDSPGCLRPSLLAMDGDAPLDLLLSLDGFSSTNGVGSPAVQLAGLLDAWLQGEGDRIAPLVRRAANDPRAKDLLRTLALVDDRVAKVADKALLVSIGVPTELSPEHVLARLDRAASGPAEDQSRWPRFFHNQYPGQAEYHAMRLFAAREREGDGWTVVLERLTGYGNNLRVMRYVYPQPGGHVEAADKPLHPEIDYEAKIDTDALSMLTEPPDYWAAREAKSSVAPLRAYVDAHAASFFAAQKELLEGLKAPIVIADTMAFAHADGPEAPQDTERRPTQIRPSESLAYRTLAKAIATREPRDFDPAEPNTDWRRHAIFRAEPD